MAFDMPYDELEQLKARFPEQDLEKFRLVFSIFDQDGDGVIRTDEVGTVMRNCGLCVTQAELVQSLDEFSGEDPNNVDFPQFLTIMARKYKDVPQDKEEEDLLEAFRVFDKEDNGYISIRDLRNISITLGESFLPEEADNLIKDADVHGEGLVNIKQFVKTLCKR